MELKNEIILKVRKDVALKKAMVRRIGCSSETIRRWVRDNDFALTTNICLRMISARYRIPMDELIEVDNEPLFDDLIETNPYDNEAV